MQKVRIAANGPTLSVINHQNEFIATFSGRRGIRKKVTAWLKRHHMKADAISQDYFPWLKRNHRRK